MAPSEPPPPEIHTMEYVLGCNPDDSVYLIGFELYTTDETEFKPETYTLVSNGDIEKSSGYEYR